MEPESDWPDKNWPMEESGRNMAQNKRTKRMNDEVNWERKVWGVVVTAIITVVVIAGAVSWRGVSRGCSGCYAQNVGADWVVVQLDLAGEPFRCWELHSVSIANESQSDGIYWEEENGNLVHISGLYNRVQVEDESWEDAFDSLGLSQETCEAISRSRVALTPGTPDRNVTCRCSCPSSDAPACPSIDDLIGAMEVPPNMRNLGRQGL